ncbi:MAG TPA: cupredoxin domain-containing protein [Nitrososphaerales archaeon]|nr:cupredoxin domain-containing protein [Nitrososphaerales archaeon]
METRAGRETRRGITNLEGALVALLLVFGTLTLSYVTATMSNSTEITSLQSELATQTGSHTTVTAATPTGPLPLMNQTTTVRQIIETWYLSPSAHQDRFEPAFPVVNQGDTVQFILIDNDTVAHDLVIGPPYNIVINATVPGLINDLTQQTFTTNATNNSPGVVVTGTPGNVTATYSFVAKYAGVYEFVCTYHAQIGMVGYLTVLPNAAYGAKASAGQSGASGGSTVTVSMIPGSGGNTSIGKAYQPDPLTVVVGINSTVKWVNNDSAPHTVTADDASFDSGNVAPGQSFTFTFTTPGTYQYHCVYHPWMVGTVIVKAG